MTLQKSDIITRFMDQTPFTRKESSLIFDTFLDILADGLGEGQDITIRGFGTFEAYQTSVTGPIEGTRFEGAAPKTKVRFRIGQKLLKMLNPDRR